MIVAKWKDHVFEISPTVIRGIDAISIKGASEIEEKQSGSQKYVSRKAGKPFDVSFTVLLNGHMGCDVRKEAMTFVREARKGEKGYLYMGGKKLVKTKLMLVEASIDEVAIVPGGQWAKCRVALSMRQTSKKNSSKNDKKPKNPAPKNPTPPPAPPAKKPGGGSGTPNLGEYR